MFADMLALKANRHRNMVIAMIMSKISFKSLITFARDSDVVDELFVTTVKNDGSTSAKADDNSLVNAESWGSVSFINREVYKISSIVLNDFCILCKGMLIIASLFKAYVDNGRGQLSNSNRGLY